MCNAILFKILYSVANYISINKYWINLSSHSSLARCLSENSCSQNTTLNIVLLFLTQLTKNFAILILKSYAEASWSWGLVFTL